MSFWRKNLWNYDVAETTLLQFLKFKIGIQNVTQKIIICELWYTGGGIGSSSLEMSCQEK